MKMPLGERLDRQRHEITVDSGIAASAHVLASQAGIEMLKKGGNAVDAAAAISFAIGVVEPFMSGIGGGGVINITFGDGEQCVIDGFVQAPENLENFDWSTVGHKVAGVPGIVAGFALALKKYGKLTLRDVIQPAIKYANNGFKISSYMARAISRSISRMNGYGAKILAKGGFSGLGRGSKTPNAAIPSLMEGDKFINKSLAKTLELISNEGEDAFYRGEIAKKIVSDMKLNGGLITMEDLALYEPRIYKPLITTFKDYEIQSVPYNHGGVTVVHMLNMLEQFDPENLEYDSVEYYHRLAEIQKRAFIDRLTYYGDYYFAKVPWTGITSKEYAKTLVETIDSLHSSGIVEPGNPWIHEKLISKPDKSLACTTYYPEFESDEGGFTTSFSVIDKDRNMVATTQSNGPTFGSGVCVPKCGMWLNGFMYNRGSSGFFPIWGHPNSLESGKRPLNNHSPTLVFRDHKPFMAFGSPAGRRQQGACVQTFLHVVLHNMGIQEAISAPRSHAEGNTIWMESRINKEKREILRNMGHDVTLKPEYDMFFGGLNGVLVDKDNLLHGGADPRRPCAAVGYEGD